MKNEYDIKIVTKKECELILLKFHYLKDISKGFKSGINYGLFKNKELLGVVFLLDSLFLNCQKECLD